MTTFQILLVICLIIIAVLIATVAVILIKRHKYEKLKTAMLSHRELWIYYLNEPELAGILSNNNGTGDCKVNADKMTEKQYRFLVLFLNHMESLVPSWKQYEKDWVGLFKNTCIRKVYENTKLYRTKGFCKLIDGIISSYDK